MATAIVLTIVLIYCAFHVGHGTSSYRHARAAGHGRKPSLYLGALGPWLTSPGPFGTRIGHRL